MGDLDPELMSVDDAEAEAVARAMCQAEGDDPDGPHPDDLAEGRSDGFPLWMFYGHAARAAILRLDQVREGSGK